ncbi:hypothetical protein K461DRAFT_269744 [Myriangium duriaei CBS 260.36]|uniref:Uncharacterized protein n=1 Tax=Myriangium duriaei CBS 260.36 TaxID=1168546 RepID=A0A9P4IX38_9PEZI|nr:hypothetical protein K461DRAFT_269744 [Myriangium duriaei CBS 260.36]
MANMILSFALLIFAASMLAGLVDSNTLMCPSTSSVSWRRPFVNNKNAGHIFNSILDSMRQFGESLHHNGMSFFFATVPQGTELYRGTAISKPVTRMQFLAFEPEHALAVVRTVNPKATHLYFHTYRTKRILRLIYIDGQSAAKSKKGVFDTQDFVIRDGTKPAPPSIDPPGALGDSERAVELCDVLKDKVDGFIRMQGGFETLLCSNQHHPPLRLVKINPLSLATKTNWMNLGQAVAARYDGIGNHRVVLNYDHMISLYAYGDLVYFDSLGLPRINNQSTWLSAAKSDLFDLAKRSTHQSHNHDWQAVVDMIVARYGDKIQYLASGMIRDSKEFISFVSPIMDPFIDYSHRDPKREAIACVAQFWPDDTHCNWWSCPKCSVAAQAIHRVARRICTTFSTIEVGDSADLIKVQNDFQSLQAWLGWSSFKRCRACTVDGICVVPIWPVGTRQEYHQPQCRRSMHGLIGSNNTYWND